MFSKLKGKVKKTRIWNHSTLKKAIDDGGIDLLPDEALDALLKNIKVYLEYALKSNASAESFHELLHLMDDAPAKDRSELLQGLVDENISRDTQKISPHLYISKIQVLLQFVKQQVPNEAERNYEALIDRSYCYMIDVYNQMSLAHLTYKQYHYYASRSYKSINYNLLSSLVIDTSCILQALFNEMGEEAFDKLYFKTSYKYSKDEDHTLTPISVLIHPRSGFQCDYLHGDLITLKVLIEDILSREFLGYLVDFQKSDEKKELPVHLEALLRTSYPYAYQDDDLPASVPDYLYRRNEYSAAHHDYPYRRDDLPASTLKAGVYPNYPAYAREEESSTIYYSRRDKLTAEVRRNSFEITFKYIDMTCGLEKISNPENKIVSAIRVHSFYFMKSELLKEKLKQWLSTEWERERGGKDHNNILHLMITDNNDYEIQLAVILDIVGEDEFTALLLEKNRARITPIEMLQERGYENKEMLLEKLNAFITAQAWLDYPFDDDKKQENTSTSQEQKMPAPRSTTSTSKMLSMLPKRLLASAATDRAALLEHDVSAAPVGDAAPEDGEQPSQRDAWTTAISADLTSEYSDTTPVEDQELDKESADDENDSEATSEKKSQAADEPLIDLTF